MATLYNVLITIQFAFLLASPHDTATSICKEGEFSVDHGCIDCFDNTVYSLMILLLCLSVLLISTMTMLFHAPMAYRTSSIWVWIQIAALIFYRASAEFLPADKQWGFISTITIFSTSLWNSKCKHPQWDQGTSFGIVILEICTFFFIFLCSTYMHHFIRHSKPMINLNHSLSNTNYLMSAAEYRKYRHNQNPVQKYARILINWLAAFERGWQYEGNNHRNNNNEDDGIPSQVTISQQPPQHPIHPMSSKHPQPHSPLLLPRVPNGNGSPTLTPATLTKPERSLHKAQPNKTRMSVLSVPTANNSVLTPTSNLRAVSVESTRTQTQTQYSSNMTENVIINLQKRNSKKKLQEKLHAHMVSHDTINTESATLSTKSSQVPLPLPQLQAESRASTKNPIIHLLDNTSSSPLPGTSLNYNEEYSSFTLAHLQAEEVNEPQYEQSDTGTCTKTGNCKQSQEHSDKKKQKSFNFSSASSVPAMQHSDNSGGGDDVLMLQLHTGHRSVSSFTEEHLPTINEIPSSKSKEDNKSPTGHAAGLHRQYLSGSKQTVLSDSGTTTDDNHDIIDMLPETNPVIDSNNSTKSEMPTPIQVDPTIDKMYKIGKIDKNNLVYLSSYDQASPTVPDISDSRVVPKSITTNRISRSAVSQSSTTNISGFSNAYGLNSPSFNSPQNHPLPSPSKKSRKLMKKKRSNKQKFLHHHNHGADFAVTAPTQIGVLKDEKAFKYSGSDPNQVLSDDTYTYMVDVVDHANHARSESFVIHSKKRDYPPQCDTMISQTESSNHKTLFAFPNTNILNNNNSNNNINHPNNNNIPNNMPVIIDNPSISRPSAPIIPGVDDDDFQQYLRVNSLVVSYLKNVPQTNAAGTTATASATAAATQPQPEQAAIMHTPSPPSHPSHHYVDNNLSPATRPLTITMDLEYNLYDGLLTLQQRQEAPSEMAFNMTFLMCSPLILMEALDMFHCSTTGEISIRSKSQLECNKDFWYYFAIFFLIGWFLYVFISIYRTREFAKKSESNTDERVHEIYRNAFGDSLRCFWINNVKLNKWWYGFVPLFLQLFIVLISVLIEDENSAMMLVVLLLWFEFVTMCCIRPFLTASDRLCQFTLRTFILFEASILLVTAKSSNDNFEGINVAVCSVTFVTVIFSHLAACCGLYPIHPNNTVCSSCCCCCCCFFCVEVINDDESEIGDVEDEEETYQHVQEVQLPTQPQQQQQQQPQVVNGDAQQPQPQVRFKSFSEVGSDQPLLNESGNSHTNHDNEKKEGMKEETILPPPSVVPLANNQKQISVHTITPYHGSGQGQQATNNPKKFVYSAHSNSYLNHLQQSAFHKHYNSRTVTDTQASQSNNESNHELKFHTKTLTNSTNFQFSVQDDDNMHVKEGSERFSSGFYSEDIKPDPAANNNNNVKKNTFNFNTTAMVAVNAANTAPHVALKNVPSASTATPDLDYNNTRNSMDSNAQTNANAHR